MPNQNTEPQPRKQLSNDRGQDAERSVDGWDDDDVEHLGEEELSTADADFDDTTDEMSADDADLDGPLDAGFDVESEAPRTRRADNAQQEIEQPQRDEDIEIDDLDVPKGR